MKDHCTGPNQYKPQGPENPLCTSSLGEVDMCDWVCCPKTLDGRILLPGCASRVDEPGALALPILLDLCPLFHPSLWLRRRIIPAIDINDNMVLAMLPEKTELEDDEKPPLSLGLTL